MEDDALVEPATFDEPLLVRSENVWDRRIIPVCWNFTGNASEKLWVRRVLQNRTAKIGLRDESPPR